MTLYPLLFMHAFPGSVITVRPDPGAWEVFKLVGALPPGARDWSVDNDIYFEPAVGGYVARYARGQSRGRDEKDLRHLLLQAQAYFEDVESGLQDGTYDAKDNEHHDDNRLALRRLGPKFVKLGWNLEEECVKV